MNEEALRILLVEDCEEDVKICQGAVRRFKDESIHQADDLRQRRIIADTVRTAF